MPLELQTGPRGVHRIDAIRGGRFVVAGEPRAASILIWPGGIEDAGDALTIEAFAPLLALDPAREVLLVGTGATLRWPDQALLDTLAAKGAGVDVMTSQLAARTYNVLAGEGRLVGALLLGLGA
ncbi:Mth938-like domain-containing protein [Sphingosinicella sp.]|uniref:Mth938-like domain-containing protein n=1 Tax=Sphingosinicella sp. TaxID=1917971 RepID=UPI0025DCAB2A|nr:Mth938-like domain-containing protein [Sphingosinicella sp.]